MRYVRYFLWERDAEEKGEILQDCADSAAEDCSGRKGKFFRTMLIPLLDWGLGSLYTFVPTTILLILTAGLCVTGHILFQVWIKLCLEKHMKHKGEIKLCLEKHMRHKGEIRLYCDVTSHSHGSYLLSLPVLRLCEDWMISRMMSLSINWGISFFGICFLFGMGLSFNGVFQLLMGCFSLWWEGFTFWCVLPPGDEVFHLLMGCVISCWASSNHA